MWHTSYRNSTHTHTVRRTLLVSNGVSVFFRFIRAVDVDVDVDVDEVLINKKGGKKPKTFFLWLCRE